MDPGVSDSLGGAFPNKVYATLEIRMCSRNYRCTPAGKINSIDSRVHGNRTLYAEARSYHYKLYLLLVGSGFCFLMGMSMEGLGGIVNVYNLLLYKAATTFAALLPLLLYMNCWLILTACCKTRRKMLVLDRPSIFPLTLVFLSCSPLYSLPFPFDTCI